MSQQNTRVYSTPVFSISNTNLRSTEVFHISEAQALEMAEILALLAQSLSDPKVITTKLFDPIKDKSNKWKIKAWDAPVRGQKGVISYNPDSTIIEDLFNYILPASMGGYGDDIKSHQVVKLNNALHKIHVCSKFYLAVYKKEWINQFDALDGQVITDLFNNIKFLRDLAELSRPIEFNQTSAVTSNETSKRMEAKRVSAYKANNILALEYYCKQIGKTAQDWIDDYTNVQSKKSRILSKPSSPAVLNQLFTLDSSK